MSNPNFKKRTLVYGVGINDYKGSVKIDGTDFRLYRLWKDMLKRVYSEKYKSTEKSYIGVSCDKDWLFLSKFIKDIECLPNHDKIGFSLDKDLFGGKHYSKETCCFLPVEINSTLSMFTSKGSKYGVGIRFMDGKFCVRFCSGRREVNLGRYITLDEAKAVSYQHRKKHLISLADKYKGLLPENIYQALINYEVDI